MASEWWRSAPAGVTIAIANWNHELLLARAVASALAGIHALAELAIPGEVLVIDDHSRDGSVTLLRQLEALYYGDGLRVLLHEQRNGITVTRNHALRQATYRYIVYLDADNELSPAALPVLFRSIIDTKAAAAFGNLIAHRPDGPAMLSNESVHGRIFMDSHIDMCALWDRLQLADKGGFEEGLTVPEDLELVLHLVTAGCRLVFVPVVFGYHYHYASSWHNTVAVENPDYLQHLARVFDQLDLRRQVHANSQYLRYHPDLGYL
ncbi:MAG: glycosyltransferase [Caldilinea sp.]|nr:glycosyltransferase family 2 protein [Caldilinea sp.]MCB0136554.1 glycosyltransferase family 2 protein [Caldilineaceae bacterium]MCB0038188.1 glycosyltransferase family 2 protein [Caldilinea sp.]MCB0146226.1 glycosyltransferase family 2 protein [Caldilineaceae bacterium]MCB9115459.1 glycosyltransferase family 2 protein [Caldilineaceae bacterium]